MQKLSIQETKNIRYLISNWTIESWIFLDKVWLVCEYQKYYDKMFDENPNISYILMLWWWAFAYPTYYVNKYENKAIDVVECDIDIIQIAKDSFNLVEWNRLKVITQDAQEYINTTDKIYDAILNDLFIWNIPESAFAKEDLLIKTKQRLTQWWIYMTNILTDFNDTEFLNEVTNSLLKVFGNIKLLRVKMSYWLQNVIALCKKTF